MKEIRIRGVEEETYREIAVMAAKQGKSVPRFCMIAAIAFCIAKKKAASGAGGKGGAK